MKNSKLMYVIIVLVFGICFVSIYFSLQNISSKMDEKPNESNNVTDGNGSIDDSDNDVDSLTNEIAIVNEFVDYVKSYEVNNRVDYANPYNIYYLNSGVLNGYNYNTTNDEFVNNLNYNFGTDKGNFNGKIFITGDGSIYFSIYNDEKCYVKPFESETVEVYNVVEKDKCYKSYILNDQLSVELFVHNSVTGVLYNEGEISDSSLRIGVATNLLDMDAATYKWYRNGVLVENHSSSSLLIENDEDATYYVEMTSVDGKTAKSNSITVKIKK